MHFMGKLGLEKVSKRSRRDPDHEKTFLTFTLSVNKIILYQFSMFKSLDSIASVVGMFMYLTISKLKQVLRSRKGLGKVSTTTLIDTSLASLPTFWRKNTGNSGTSSLHHRQLHFIPSAVSREKGKSRPSS